MTKKKNFKQEEALRYIRQIKIKFYINNQNNNKQILKEIYPEKFKGICFGSNLHYHFFPKKGARIVLVATFI